MKALLTCCIPNLQMNFFALKEHLFLLKVNAYRGNVSLMKFIAYVSTDEGSFADS